METHFKGLHNISNKINGNVVLQNKRYDTLEQKIDNFRILKAEIETLNAELNHLNHIIDDGKESKIGKRKIDSNGPFGK